MRISEIIVESRSQATAKSSGYKEIEFVCVNPKFPNATDPKLQKQMYLGLKQIQGVIPLWQEWGDYSEGQVSLSAIFNDRDVRAKVLSLAKQLGVEIDLEQPVSDDYVDRAIRGEHEGQRGVAKGELDEAKRKRKHKAKSKRRSLPNRSTVPLFYGGWGWGGFEGDGGEGGGE